MNAAPSDIDNYIAAFPEAVQELLRQMRRIIREAAPEAAETISYAMPTFVLQGNLVHFAGYKSHIGFYPAPSGIRAFRDELSGYKLSKGAVQFPLDGPLPEAVITKIVCFRAEENAVKAAAKQALKMTRK